MSFSFSRKAHLRIYCAVIFFAIILRIYTTSNTFVRLSSFTSHGYSGTTSPIIAFAHRTRSAAFTSPSRLRSHLSYSSTGGRLVTEDEGVVSDVEVVDVVADVVVVTEVVEVVVEVVADVVVDVVAVVDVVVDVVVFVDVVVDVVVITLSG